MKPPTFVAASDATARRVHTIVRCLLDGTPLPDGIAIGDLGIWSELTQALLTARAQGGNR